uniref:Secreted protein n=1 Tax=Ascaris lumbricoides TaxID=6252 RepID=A0A0M3HGE5_ASCLU
MGRSFMKNLICMQSAFFHTALTFKAGQRSLFRVEVTEAESLSLRIRPFRQLDRRPLMHCQFCFFDGNMPLVVPYQHASHSDVPTTSGITSVMISAIGAVCTAIERL